MELRWIIVGTLALVIVLQLLNRIAGAIAAVLWTAALFAYGVWAFSAGQQIAFLRIAVPPWLFMATMAGMLGYNAWVLVRALRARARRA